MDTYVDLFSIGLLVLAITGTLSIVYFTWRNGVPPLPASLLLRREVEKEVKQVLEKIKQIRQHTVKDHADKASTLLPVQLVEAGSGWGTLALHLERYCPQCQVTGIENSPLPFAASRVMARLRRSKAVFIRGNMYTYNYANVDILVCYLFPGAMQQFSAILQDQARPGTYMISVYFALPGWEPEHVIHCRDIHRTRIYIYRTGHYNYMV